MDKKSKKIPKSKSKSKLIKSKFIKSIGALNEDVFMADGNPSVSNNICDVICFVLICTKHQQILLRKNRVFFPFVPLNSMKTWHESSIDGALQLLIGNQNPVKLLLLKENVPFQKLACLDIFRFQLPHTQRFITRLVYLAELNPNNQNITCCSNSNFYKWFSIQDAIDCKIFNMWGPELSYFTNMAVENYNKTSVSVQCHEYSLNDAFKHVPREMPTTYEEQLLLKTNITVNDIERLYADFLEHCFPSFFYTQASFETYLRNHQIENNPKIIKRYYTAFRYRTHPYMQFHELLLGLAAIDSRAPHEEFRIRLIFRYYDYNKDEHFDQHELRNLMKDLEPDKNANITNQQVNNLMKKIGTVQIEGKEMISYVNFKNAITKGIIRNTHKLCRTSVSPFGQITRSLATRKLCKTVSNKKLEKIILNRKQEPCLNCKKKMFEISSNLIVLDSKGMMKHIRKIPDEELCSIKPSIEKGFDRNSLLYFILNEIRRFNKEKENPRRPKIGLFSNLSKEEIQAFAFDFKTICQEVAKIVENEERILKIEDPVYVIGDIHGNLEDLISMEQCLWKSFPLLTANYLFLGDYVDRGKWGFECILYLMIIKYLAPKKIFLLRGNHEIRCIQQKYSFHKELTKKYGSVYGQQFFDWINEMFDRLAFSAIVKDSVFCAHGGLPYSEQNLEKLNKEIKHAISEPESEAIPVWEIVWSDPLDYNKFCEHAELLGLSTYQMNGLFIPNIKRGTSVFFNEYAVIAFFKENNLNYMIRAHEVPRSGFKFNFGTLCLTVFSCSHYCGADNECAVVLLEKESRIRLIRIDTTMNLPAT